MWTWFFYSLFGIRTAKDSKRTTLVGTGVHRMTATGTGVERKTVKGLK